MKISLIGSGSWSTALCQVLVDNGHNTLIYGKNINEVNDINNNHLNSYYFKDVLLNKNIKATNDIKDVSDSDIVLLAVPSIAIESVISDLKKVLDKPVIIINVAKGFHPITYDRLSVEIKKYMGSLAKSVVSLIGPSHAEEVVLRKLTLINAVSEDESAAKIVQKLFANDYFRVYTNSDVIGAEIAAALKNIIAIAGGVLEGLGQGDNARAALITRGLHEITRFGLHFGAKQETFLGLNGVGDLIVTASSHHSRNFQAGLKIASLDSAKAFLETNTKTVEGINACKVVYHLAKQEGIEMPITEQIYLTLFKDKNPKTALNDLMLRPLKNEY